MHLHQPRDQRWSTVSFSSGLLLGVQDHAAVIHPPEDVILVVGGRSSSGDTSALSRWQSIDLVASRVRAFSPPERLFASAAAYDPDPEAPRVFVFGGDRGNQRISDVLWQIDLRHGTPQMRSEAVRPRGDKPAARYAHAMAYDAHRGWLVVYGGLSANAQPINESRTWAFDTNAYVWLALDGAWAGERYGAVMVFDSRHNRMVLSGGAGRSDRDLKNSVHVLDCDDMATQEPSATPTDTAIQTPTPTLTPAPSPTAAPTRTDTPTGTAPAASATPGPTASATASAGASPTATPAAGPSPAPGLTAYLPFASRR